MAFTQGKYLIVHKYAIAKGIFDMTILCPDIANGAKQGQFVHVLAEGFSLRRPISIASIDINKGTIRIVFEVRGKGTDKIACKNAGDMIDIIGPLGKGTFTLLDKSSKVLCVGGGIGTPPMLSLAEYYRENATVISGFRDSSVAILQQDFIKTSADTIICTEDGSLGVKGYVTDAMKQILEKDKPEIIYSCGPTMMLRAVVQLATEYGIKCEVSLEERMGCGVGACLVCATKIKRNGEEQMLHVCKDGPVFIGEEVVW